MRELESTHHLRLFGAFALLASCSLEGFEGGLSKPPPGHGQGGTAGRPVGGAAGKGSGGNPLERPQAGAGGRLLTSSTLEGGTAGAAGASQHDAGVGASSAAGTLARTSGGFAAGGAGGAPIAGTSPATGGGMSAYGGEATLEAGGAAGWAAGGAGQSTSDPPPIYFSEYVEGSSNNKALEIHTTADGDLEGCVVHTYLNGEEAPSRTVTLHGPISVLRPLVVCEKSFAEPSRCDVLTTLSFNGNDRVALSCQGELLDNVGQSGTPPDKHWGTPELGTADRTLRRKCDVQTGDRDPTDAFDPAIEWRVAEIDDFADLGVHCATAL